MANIFGDNPPQDFVRGSKAWLKAKGNPVTKKLRSIKQENLDLKSRLEQLEAAVAEMVSKKKK